MTILVVAQRFEDETKVTVTKHQDGFEAAQHLAFLIHVSGVGEADAPLINAGIARDRFHAEGTFTQVLEELGVARSTTDTGPFRVWLNSHLGEFCYTV